jgi:hypothetical protein
MGLATLNELHATKAVVQIPKWGCWYADVELDGEHTLTGACTLVVADLTLKGTILSGGPIKGRSPYRVVGGKGGWRKVIARESYADDAGVKVSKVVGDAARLAGETLGPIPSSLRVGPGFTRPEEEAWKTLERVVPRGWYIDENGVTQIGTRTAGTVPAGAQRIKPVDLARGTVTLASDSIKTLLPGVVVDGLTALDVMHEVSAKGGLRTTIWGARSAGATNRGLDAFEKLLDAVDPDRRFRGVFEYRVVTRDGKRLNLQPVRVSTGLPELSRVVARPGVSGCDADVALGSYVLVGFIEADPSRPYIAAYEDAEGEGFVPDLLRLAEGSAFAARVGDSVSVTLVSLPVVGGAGGTVSGSASGTITSGSSKVKVG